MRPVLDVGDQPTDTVVDTHDYRFPLETATVNTMSSPFDSVNLPGDLPQMEWVDGTIETLKLVVKDDNVHFSLKLKPDDSDLATFDAYLGYVKNGERHGMARNSAEFVAVAIGGDIKGGRLRTKDGETSQEAISAACDMAVKSPCRFKVQTKGDYTNLKVLELL